MLAVALTAAAAAALVAAIWAAGMLPSNDGFGHLYDAHALAHLDDPAYGNYLAPQANITWHGFTEAYVLLEPLLGYRDAYRVCLILIALLVAASSFSLVVALDARRWPLGLLGFSFALNDCLYYGFLPWLCGVAFGVLGVALWVRRAPRTSDYVLLSLVLFIAALCHMVAAALAGIAALAVTLARTPTLKDVAKLAIAGAPALAIALASLGGTPTAWSQPATFAEHIQIVLETTPGPLWREVATWVVALAGAALVFARFRERSPEERALAIVGVVFLLLGLALPRDALGWQFLSLRPLLFAAIFLAPLCAPRARRSSAAVSAAVVLLVAATMLWAFDHHRALRNLTDGIVDRIDRLTPAPALRGVIVARRLPPSENVVLDWSPFMRLPQLAAVKLGGVPAYSFIGLRHFPVKLVADPPSVPPERIRDRIRADEPARTQDLRRYAAMNAPAARLLAFGSAHDLDVIQSSGWDAEQRVDGPAANDIGVLVARFAGCAAQFSVASSIEMRLAPGGESLARFDVHADEVVDALPCGPLWFRFASDACAETAVEASLTREARPTVTCTPR